MIISIASGKGGTGKTTIAVNLALALGDRAQYIDCDVEEPNGHLFLKPQITNRTPATVPIPEINKSSCLYCGHCQRACQFNALLVLPGQLLFFPELCHGCGACVLACPLQAISEKEREIGIIEAGHTDRLAFVHGVLNTGEAKAPPLIRQLKLCLDKDKEAAIIDAPPGTSCPLIASIKDSDFVVLVTEPTPFGLHDLKLAYEVIQKLQIKCGVVINRANLGDGGVEEFCRAQSLPVLLRLPFDRKIAEAYARGQNLLDTIPDFRGLMFNLYNEICHWGESKNGRVAGR